MRSYKDIKKGRGASIEQSAVQRAAGSGSSLRSVLSTLFYKMVVTMNVHKGDRWSQLMMQYARDPRNCVPQTKAHITQARGNLNKALIDKSMSWRTFGRGMRFLNLRKFKIIIEAHHPNGEITCHETMVVLDDEIMENTNDPKEE